MCVSVCVSARTFNVVCLHLWVSLPPFPSFVWLSHLPAPHHLISNFSSHSSPNNSVCCAGSLLPYTFLHATVPSVCLDHLCVPASNPAHLLPGALLPTHSPLANSVPRLSKALSPASPGLHPSHLSLKHLFPIKP